MQFFLRAWFVLLLAWPMAAQSIATIHFEPSTVRPERSAPVLLTVTMEGETGGLRLDLADGTRLPLTLSLTGAWTVTVPIADVLRDYEIADVGRKFVGFLRILGPGGKLTSSYNAFINVLDATMPRVALGTIDSDRRISPRILNLRFSGDLSSRSRESIVKQSYRTLGDDYDFINIVHTLPGLPSNRAHYVVRNTVQGIGLPLLDRGLTYGSFARLIGVNVFPIDTLFDMGEKAASHELGHQWINYIPVDRTLPGPHWPPSAMAHHLMGLNIPGGNAGGDWPWLLEQSSDGTWRFVPDPPRDDFSDLDLYLMGFLAPFQVAPQQIVTGPGDPCAECPAQVTTLTIEEVIAAAGPRIPSSESAKRSFRIATIVITRDRLLTDDELTLFDYFAARGEATTVLPSSAGLAGRTTVRPFALATRGLGRLDLSLLIPDYIVFAESFEPHRLLGSGGVVTVYGTGFTTFTTVTIDGVRVPDVAVTDARTLRFTAPPHAAGRVDVIVTTPGKGSVRVPNALIYSSRRRSV